MRFFLYITIALCLTIAAELTFIYRTDDPMENAAQENVETTVEENVEMPLETDAMKRLHECYTYLEEFARRRNMSTSVLQALHKQAADILKSLK